MTTAEETRLERVIPGVGTIEFVETEKSRAYYFLAEGGQRRVRLPSVTGILSETWPTSHQMMDWLKREGGNADTLRDSGATRGKAIHKFVERYMESGDLMKFSEYPEEYLPYFEGIARFLWDHDPKPLAIERLIVHPDLRYAGRLDLIATLDGVPTLLDFKTSASGRVYSRAHVQGAGYRMADAVCGGDPVERIAIVGIGEDGEYRICETPLKEAEDMWKLVLKMYRGIQSLEKAL
jgi:hypothetical protein